MNEPERSRPPLTVHAPLQLEPGRGFQFIEFKPGMTGVIESGCVMMDVPAVRKDGTNHPKRGLLARERTKGLAILETRANKPGSERRSAMALRPVFKALIGRLRRLIGSWQRHRDRYGRQRRDCQREVLRVLLEMRVSWALLHRRYGVLCGSNSGMALICRATGYRRGIYGRRPLHQVEP